MCWKTAGFCCLEPVLVQVEELKSEILIPVSYHCPSFRELAKKSQKLLQENQDYVCLVKAIQSHTGQLSLALPAIYIRMVMQVPCLSFLLFI